MAIEEPTYAEVYDKPGGGDKMVDTHIMEGRSTFYRRRHATNDV